MPSLRDLDHDGIFYTISPRPVQVMWSIMAGRIDRHHVQNHTLLGHSPPASQAGRRAGTAL
jgi:hypothetical protein